MTEQQITPATNIPGTTVPDTRLYSLTCTPISGKTFAILEGDDIPQPIWYKLVVAAPTSSEATRKAVGFFKTYAPTLGITGIEVLRFEALTSLSDTIVVV